MKDTRCVLPWIHLASHPNGGVSLCCRSNHQNAISWAKKSEENLLFLGKNSLSEIINSDKFVSVRRAMNLGQEPVECEGCWKDEHAGIESKRQYENRRWEKIIPLIPQNEILSEPDFRYIELRLGNICNNACLTCNSYSSTKWYPDEKKLANKLSWFQLRPMENFHWFEDPEFYRELAQYSKNAEEIYINGGEPTLIKAHYEYLKYLIKDNVSQKIHLVYSLNMMDIPDDLIELWKNFKKVTVNASIDDLHERNYYIRYPTKWTETISSINKLNTIDNIDWHVTQTVSMLNVFNLGEFSRWLRFEYNKIPHHNYVLYPDYLSLSVLPEKYKSEIISKYSNSNLLIERQRNDLFKKLEVKFDSELLSKCGEFIHAMDDIRNLKVYDYIPELKSIL